jgi:hypothetical protein
MISVVILNWKRQQNIIDHIIPKIIQYDLINDIIISHGNISTYFSTPEYPNIKHYYDSDKNMSLGLSLRFFRAVEALNNCILFIDDDKCPSEKYVRNLYSKFIEDPIQIIAVQKRYISPLLGYYRWPILKNLFEKKIVLTQIMMTNKQCCYDFLAEKNKIEYITKSKKSKPTWNGEDIIFNVIFRKKYRKEPIHIRSSEENGYIDQLDSPYAVSNNKGNRRYRNILSRKAYSKYNLYFRI